MRVCVSRQIKHLSWRCVLMNNCDNLNGELNLFHFFLLGFCGLSVFDCFLNFPQHTHIHKQAKGNTCIQILILIEYADTNTYVDIHFMCIFHLVVYFVVFCRRHCQPVCLPSNRLAALKRAK